VNNATQPLEDLKSTTGETIRAAVSRLYAMQQRLYVLARVIGADQDSGDFPPVVGRRSRGDCELDRHRSGRERSARGSA
jgi:hypothetical protein